MKHNIYFRIIKQYNYDTFDLVFICTEEININIDNKLLNKL